MYWCDSAYFLCLQYINIKYMGLFHRLFKSIDQIAGRASDQHSFPSGAGENTNNTNKAIRISTAPHSWTSRGSITFAEVIKTFKELSWRLKSQEIRWDIWKYVCRLLLIWSVLDISSSGMGMDKHKQVWRLQLLPQARHNTPAYNPLRCPLVVHPIPCITTVAQTHPVPAQVR